MRLILLLILLLPSYIHAYKNDTHYLTSEKSFVHAQKLFEQGDYYRSITEFKRYIFFGKNKLNKENAQFSIGLNYLMGKDYDNARIIFNKINNTPFHSQEKKAALKLADTYLYEEKSLLKQHKYHWFNTLRFTDIYYNNYLKEYYDNDKYRDEAYMKLLLVNMMNLNRYNTFYLINNARITDSKYKLLLKKMNPMARKMDQIGKKSEFVATLLSVIIPGMGQIYAGEVKEGLIALVVNVTMGYAAYQTFIGYSQLLGVMIFQYELTYYFGNIINAQRAVEKYNENQKNLFRQELLSIYF